MHFFLSHAYGDDDSYVARFFQDLSAEVRLVTDRADEVGFLDPAARDDRPAWSSAADQALSTSRVFIALYAPTYFLTARCGQEWTLFTERIRHHERTTGTRVAALFPIHWGGPLVIDPDFRGAAPALPSPGPEGLRQLVRLSNRREAYRGFVSRLARRIVEVAEESDLLPSAPVADLASVPNAFESRGTGAGPGPSGVPARVVASLPAQPVSFVVAAGTRGEMRAIRRDLDAYGPAREDWTPYRPALPVPLAAHARRVAARRRFRSEIAGIDGLPERIDRAARNNEIVVLLVDAWATKVETCWRVLRRTDVHGRPTVAVLVSVDRGDAETSRHRGELRSELDRAFPRARHDPMFRPDVESPSTFDADLVAVLEEAKNRIFRSGRIFRRPPAEREVARPILEGP